MNPAVVKYSISDLAKLSGIKPHTIRIWEQRYGLLKPQRTDTQIRYYTDGDVRQIMNVSLLNRNGFKISKIACLCATEIQNKVHELENACTENQIVIDQLIKCMVAFDEWQFEKIINSAINRLGFKAVLLEMLYPFLEKIGILWMTGNISPAQEHFISNIIRQKIIVAIDGQHVQPHTAQKKIIMFLPQNEFHELSLLFFNYYFKTQQQHIIYLGANVPYADMQQVIDVYHPDYLFTVLTSSIYIKPTTQMLTNLANKNQSIKLMVAGAQVCHLRHAALPNLHCFTSLQEVLQFKP